MLAHESSDWPALGLDPDRLRALAEREAADFAARTPRSTDLRHSARTRMPRGVPTGFMARLAHAHGSRSRRDARPALSPRLQSGSILRPPMRRGTQRWVVRVPPDPHVRFDTNDYSLDPNGSDRLITPSGISGAVNGLLLPFKTRPSVSRSVARHRS